MEGKHTPGPWRMGAAKHRLYDRILAPGPQSGVHANVICYMNALLPNIDEADYCAQHPDATPQPGLANARLIAAAPELLEACEIMTKIGCDACPLVFPVGKNCTVNKCFYAKSHAIISRARGETEDITWNRRTPEPMTSVIRWVRYDGSDSAAAALHGEDRTIVIYSRDGYGLFVVDDAVKAEEIINVGDLWAYLPEPPEGVA